MRTAGNNSLFLQPRSGGCLTLRRQGGQQAPDGVMAVRSSGLQRSPPFPTPSTSTSGLSPPPCRGLIAATPWPVAPFPPPLAGPVPTASQPHTAPCLSAGPCRAFSEIWNPVSKARMLKPFDQPALSVAFNCLPRRSPTSPSVALSAGSPSSSLTSPAFQPSPMQFLPYLSHKIHFQKSLFPTPQRPPCPPPPGCAGSCLCYASRGCVLHLPPWAQAGTWTDELGAGPREGANREGRFHNWKGERKEETQGSLTWS